MDILGTVTSFLAVSLGASASQLLSSSFFTPVPWIPPTGLLNVMQLSTPMIAPSGTLMNLTGRYNGLQPLPYHIAKKFQVPIFTVATVSNRPSLVLAKRAINFGPLGCVLCSMVVSFALTGKPAPQRAIYFGPTHARRGCVLCLARPITAG